MFEPKKRCVTLALCSALVGASWSWPAFTQEAGCACSTAFSEAGGRIVSATGEVLVSGRDGLVPVRRDTELTTGSQVVTGTHASAEIDIGRCTLHLQPNSEMTIARTGDSLCVRVSRAGVPANGGETPDRSAESAGSGEGAFDTAIILGGIGAGALAAAAAAGGGSDEKIVTGGDDAVSD